MSDHKDTTLGSALREAAGEYRHGFKIDIIRENLDAIEWALSAKHDGRRLRIKTVVEIINKEFGLDFVEDTFRNYLSRVRKERKSHPREERGTAATPPIVGRPEAAERSTTARRSVAEESPASTASKALADRYTNDTAEVSAFFNSLRKEGKDK